MLTMTMAWLMSVEVFSLEMSSHSFNIFSLLSRPSGIVNKMEHLTWSLSYPHFTYFLLNTEKVERIKQLIDVTTIVL